MTKTDPADYTDRISDHARARCLTCGCSWKYFRHHALVCPYCAEPFGAAYFWPLDPTYVEFGGTTKEHSL